MNLGKIVFMGATVINTLFGSPSCNQTNQIKEVTEIFRGYHNDIEEGKQILILDNETKELRNSPKDINLKVYGSRADTLDLNKTYIVGYIPSRIKNWPGNLKYIKETDTLGSN